MNDLPNWVVPLLSTAGAAMGGWVAVRVAVARLEVTVARAVKDLSEHAAKIALHSDDLNAHDLEIDQLMGKASLKRVRRQPLRGEWG